MKALKKILVIFQKSTAFKLQRLEGIDFPCVMSFW